MQKQSETLEAQQGFTSNPEQIDIAAIAEQYPVNQRTAVLDLNTFDATGLTLLEVLDMAETTGVDASELGTLMASRNSKRMRLMYALAWVVARRANPMLTFEEVATWKLTVIGEVDPNKAIKSQKRADMIVAASSVSGLPPREAEQLTVAEISAYQDRNKRTNRAMRRRKAG